MSVTQMPLRIPASLHVLLKEKAEGEGVSLNQYCLYLLSRHSGGEKDLSREKAENLMRFLEEAHLLQKEMRREENHRVETSLQETPLQRWRKIHGKNRRPAH